MSVGIVLAMHGSPPRDFPPDQLAELMGLHARMHQAREGELEGLAARHDRLEATMRAWPRSADNDPFWAASVDMAEHLERETGLRVVVGFNEFCGPTVEEAVDALVKGGARRVVVTTPMMTRGGEHSERDIPEALERARAAHPGVDVVFAWPFDMADVARFLADHVRPHLG